MLTMKAVVIPTVAPRAQPPYPPTVAPMKEKSFPIPNGRLLDGVGTPENAYATESSVYSLAPTHAEIRKFTNPTNANVHQSPIDIIPMCM